MYANSNECEKADLDEKEVERIARGLASYAKQAEKMGMTIFGGSSLSLRFKDDNDLGALIVADCIANNVDGGCGSHTYCEDGLMRGEL